MRTKPISLLVFTLFVSSLALSDEPDPRIQLGTPAYAGSGCPLGSLGLALSPDARTLSLVFDSFEARSEIGSSYRYVRKSCDLVIPVHVPAGYSVLPVKGKFSGAYKIASNASAWVQVIRAWSGVENSRQRVEFGGATEDSFDIDVTPHTEMWSPCGADVSLRYSFLLQLDVRDLSKESYVRLETLQPSPDETSFLWRKCN